jgi:hypothetical protein
MSKQLTFASLGERGTRHAERITVNPSVPIETAPRLKKQAKHILAALKRGPLWTNDLRSMAAQYNARIKELRDRLQEFGLTVDMTAKGKDGNNRYELKPFAGSRYQAELMAKQQRAGHKRQRSD